MFSDTRTFRRGSLLGIRHDVSIAQDVRVMEQLEHKRTLVSVTLQNCT